MNGGPALSEIVKALENSNIGLADITSEESKEAEIEFLAVLEHVKSQRGTMSFFDVLEARRILQESNQFDPTQLSKTQDELSKTPDDLNSEQDPMNYAEHLNVALDAILNTNSAIASTHIGAIDAALAALVETTQEAQSASPSPQKLSP